MQSIGSLATEIKDLHAGVQRARALALAKEERSGRLRAIGTAATLRERQDTRGPPSTRRSPMVAWHGGFDHATTTNGLSACVCAYLGRIPISRKPPSHDKTKTSTSSGILEGKPTDALQRTRGTKARPRSGVRGQVSEVRCQVSGISPL